MSTFETIGFGKNDEKVGKGKRKKFKFEEGKKYRITFALWPIIEKDGRDVLDFECGTPSIEFNKTNYIDGVGHVINKGPEYTKVAGEAPKPRCGTVLISWPLTREGKLDQDAVKQGKWSVEPYIFSDKKFNLFKDLHVDWNFGECDVKVTCTDTQYQKITIAPLKNNMLRMLQEKSPKVFAEALEEIREVSTQLHWLIGSDMSLDRLREKLGQETDGPTGSSSGPAEVALDEEDFDNMLGDLGLDDEDE